MATEISLTDNNSQSREIFSIIWLDHNPNEDRNTKQKLRSIINHFKKFRDVQQCQQYIEQTSSKNRLILIVSGSLGRELLPSIHDTRQIISIYIYCMDKELNELWSSKFTKVKGVFTEIDELIDEIKEEHRIQRRTEEPLTINIFSTSGGQSTTKLNGQFIFSQLLIDCLLRLKSNEIDQNELIQLLKQQYKENVLEINNMKEFKRDYKPDDVLSWYTRETFFYKTLNSSLRTENTHLTFLFRSFISDIQQQLEKYQTNEVIKVYRGQIISKDELEHLKQATNQFISINSFFSTSIHRSQALRFLEQSKSIENTEKIFFKIEANPNLVSKKPFANISQFSDYPNEGEVLFMIGSIFRLEKISFNDDKQIWIVKMILSSDDDNDLKDVLIYMKQRLGNGDTNLRILAKILADMGKPDLAEMYVKRSIEQLSSDDPLLADLYDDLSKLASQSRNYDVSLKWLQKSMATKSQHKITSSIDSDESPSIPTTPATPIPTTSPSNPIESASIPTVAAPVTNEASYIVNTSRYTSQDEDRFSFSTILTNVMKRYTVSIRNSSGIKRQVLIVSEENAWEWILSPKEFKTFDFGSFTNTFFNMSDYTSGIQFDIYGRGAPMWKDNDIELFDTYIRLNEKSISYDELRRKKEPMSTTTHKPMTSVISTEHQEFFHKVYGKSAKITGIKRNTCKDVGGFMSGDACVAGKYLYSQGIYKIYLRLNYGKPFLGIISWEKAKELLNLSSTDILKGCRYHNLDEVYGWCTKTGRSIVNGNTLGDGNGSYKQWSKSDEDGDVFELKIDCENQKLSIINKRTNDRDVILVSVPLPWQLFITFCATIGEVVLVTGRAGEGQ